MACTLLKPTISINLCQPTLSMNSANLSPGWACSLQTSTALLTTATISSYLGGTAGIHGISNLPSRGPYLC